MKWYKRTHRQDIPELWPETYIIKQWQKALRGDDEEDFPFSDYLRIAGLTEASVEDAKAFYLEATYDTGHLSEAIIDFAGLQRPETTEELYDITIPAAKRILGMSK